MRMIVLALVTLVGAAAPARADVLPLFDGVPEYYTPGQSFTFTLRAPGISLLTDFNLDLIVETDVGTPGTNEIPLSVTIGLPSNYAFAPSTTLASTITPSPNNPQLIVNLSGATTGGGVSTVAGLNDGLAEITILPNSDFAGRITLSIGAATFNPPPESGPRIDPPPSVFVDLDSGSPPSSPVPAPGSALLLGLGGLGLLARGRFGRRA